MNIIKPLFYKKVDSNMFHLSVEEVYLFVSIYISTMFVRILIFRLY